VELLVLELPGIAHAITDDERGGWPRRPRSRRASASARGRGNVSLSVRHEYDQQRRTFREAVCEERVGAAAGAGAPRQARGVILSTEQLRKSKGESVSGAERRRAKRAEV